MKTSNFFHYRGPGRVSIARSEPRGTPGGYRKYKALAPTREMLRMDYNRYRDLYFGEILRPLSPLKVVDDLRDLTGGAEPVLLCWEDITKPGQWCHRRMVAEWLQDRLGIDIPEIGQ